MKTKEELQIELDHYTEKIVELEEKRIQVRIEMLDAFPTVDSIILYVCKAYNTNSEELLSKKRIKELKEPKKLLILLLRDCCRYSYDRIATIMWWLNHSAIIYQHKKATELLCNDRVFLNLYNTFLKWI